MERDLREVNRSLLILYGPFPEFMIHFLMKTYVHHFYNSDQI